MIEVHDLAKAFGRVQAVDGLSVLARDGEITGLIGPNGAGKTTTFRVIYGLLKPDRGHAQVDGLDTTEQRIEAQRRLGVLPDVRGLYPRLTAREHIRYYGNLHGLSGPALEARIEELVQRLGMAEFADRRAKGFSRGQELKVALGRALVHAPHNIILDEPTNGLDVVSSRAVRQLIREMRDAGHCILLSSHIMAEVQALCDRLIIISHGRSLISGTPDELRALTGAEDLEDVFVQALNPSLGLGLPRAAAL
ncbi:ABC transporter ATP-binding protein [Zavarzinia sp. CC-PAN008]|uniref:ABC transporter ATP-binding protein n=1 Tax=Zavarzinia sp. CC-PAN008 TaxID=3243332 RepID=UPI003F742BBA